MNHPPSHRYALGRGPKVCDLRPNGRYHDLADASQPGTIGRREQIGGIGDRYEQPEQGARAEISLNFTNLVGWEALATPAALEQKAPL